MADEREREREENDEEFRVTVRDRRRVTLEGELREPDGGESPEESAESTTPPPAARPAPEPASERPEPPRRKTSGPALGGAEQARVLKDRAPLREVPPEPDEVDEDEYADAPRIRDVYEYVQFLASDLSIWSFASLGLMPNPVTRLVTTDMDQATFAVETIETLLGKLAESGKVELEQQLALYHGLAFQYGQVAAQLLNQPPDVRLQEMERIRFCIDAAGRFVDGLADLGEAVDIGRLNELKNFVAQLKMLFLQVSGGGAIV